MIVENVQCRATKTVPESAHMKYEDRLRELRLPIYQRLREDLIEANKMTHGLYNVDTENYLSRSMDDHTRDHQIKIKKRASRLDIREHYLL